MTTEILKTKIDEILKNMYGVNEDGGIEIYTDYRDRELSDSFLKKIFEHVIQEKHLMMNWLNGPMIMNRIMEKMN